MADTTPHTYRKVATVKAMQWDGTDESAQTIIEWTGEKVAHVKGSHGMVNHLLVNTLEGPLGMSSGDWILMGDEGEFWPNRGDIFARSYVEVTDA